ncbi:MAG: xylulokinase [Clostridia bacterium]|nr:xylulokinase [Clostridia bacterium]
MPLRYILAHDLGTTGNKATLYDAEGCLTGSTFFPYDTSYSNGNWAEQNPGDWWKAVCSATRELMHKSGLAAESIACISFSGQMMGCVAVDKNRMPLRKAIIWADQRAVKEEQFLKDNIGMKRMYHITGHRASASYSLEKILWIKDNEPDIYERTHKFLHAKDYMVLKLTGRFVSDYSDASGMNLLDIKEMKWSQYIMGVSGIAEEKLPELHFSTDVVGEVTKQAAEDTGLKPGIPVVIGAGDGMCAAVGAAVVNEGSAYNYLGSSSWIGIAAKGPVYDEKMRTFNWVHAVPGLYSPTGTMQSAGGSVQWFKNTLCQLESLIAEEVGENPYALIDKKVEKSEPGADRLLYLPYLIGERSPHWNTNARGAFVGLSMTHTKEDICRAVLEGITFNLRIILDAFAEKVNIDEIKLIGGGAKSHVWRQIFADIFGIRIAKPVLLDEATSLGAAIIGGVGVGLFKDFNIAEKLVQIESVDKPRHNYRERYESLYDIFKYSYSQLEDVYNRMATLK